jgi:hypothetical protein
MITLTAVEAQQSWLHKLVAGVNAFAIRWLFLQRNV